jgi:hypothetical protein
LFSTALHNIKGIQVLNDTTNYNVYFEDNCNQEYLDGLPSINFTFSKVNNYSIPPSLYLQNNTPPNGYCIVLIDSMPLEDYYYGIGDVFLRKYYSIYDSESLQVGFATNIYFGDLN